MNSSGLTDVKLVAELVGSGTLHCVLQMYEGHFLCS